jgi:hypothetical protein
MKNLKLMNILPMALGVAVGFIVYKVIAKMIGDQDEVEAMLSARGSFRKRPGILKMNPDDYCQVDSTNSPSGLQHYPINSTACKTIANCKESGGEPVHTSLDGNSGIIECLGGSQSPLVVGPNGMPLRKETRKRMF